jgi:AcrR family transcriptional regulator
VRPAGQAETAQVSSSRVARKRTRKIRDILLATASVLYERGYHAMSMDDVAAQLDLTKATLYHYFHSKEDLVSECLTFVGNEVNERLAKLADETAGESPTNRLRALLHEQLTILLLDYPEAGRLFVQPLDWPAGQRQLVRKLRDEHDRFFRDVIADGIRSGDFRDIDSTIVRHCIHGAVNYVPVWAQSRRRGDLTAISDQVVDHLLKLVR